MYSVLMRQRSAKSEALSASFAASACTRRNSSSGTNCKSITLRTAYWFSLNVNRPRPWHLLYSRQRGFARFHVVLREHPVFASVHVEAFESLGEERHHHVTGDRAPVHDHPRPRDLER